MYFLHSQPEDPKKVYLKINKIIFSCKTIKQISSCLKLLENFIKMYGNYNDGEYSVNQLYFNLTHHQRSILIKNQIEAIAKKKEISSTKRETVQFLRDPTTHFIFAYFPHYKTKNPQKLKLCYYMGKYCELETEYINKCEHPIFPEYRDLLFHLKDKMQLLVLTPFIKEN